MKLDLGCGQKPREGYIGVDLCEGAEVQRDITLLPDEWEGKVDEIICIHAFEHLTYRQTDVALMEWRRVLKDGGKLIIEVPNLKQACLSFLSDEKNLTNGIGRIYGPQWEDESLLAVHKSGWTPDLLSRSLKHAGFKNVKQAKAQFHKREPYDFRMEATK
jgi:ubiquinone/menaquinone biosynthesis C-methylase UbiE